MPEFFDLAKESQNVPGAAAGGRAAGAGGLSRFATAARRECGHFEVTVGKKA
jgi:hypothetical protein